MTKITEILKKAKEVGGATFSIDHASEMLGRLKRGDKICVKYINSKHNGWDEITLKQAQKLRTFAREVNHKGPENEYFIN